MQNDSPLPTPAPEFSPESVSSSSEITRGKPLVTLSKNSTSDLWSYPSEFPSSLYLCSLSASLLPPLCPGHPGSTQPGNGCP